MMRGGTKNLNLPSMCLSRCVHSAVEVRIESPERPDMGAALTAFAYADQPGWVVVQ